MPPRGVKSSKRKRQYEHIKESELKEGRSTKRAKQIAAATVNKQRRQSGQTKEQRRGRKSTGRKSSSRRSGSRKSSRKSSSRRSRSRKSR